MNNADETLRCMSCGQVDRPDSVASGSGRVALGAWVLTAVVWALGMALAVPTLTWIAAALFLAAFVYSLRYLFRREQACRHCGGRRLEPVTEGSAS